MFSVGQALNVGIPEIDQDHENLDVLIKNIQRALVTDASVEEIQDISSRFISAIKVHFEREEAILHPFSLPKMEAHKIEHKRLLRDLEKVNSSISDTNSLWRDALVDLTDTITRHIIAFDFEVKKCLD